MCTFNQGLQTFYARGEVLERFIIAKFGVRRMPGVRNKFLALTLLAAPAAALKVPIGSSVQARRSVLGGAAAMFASQLTRSAASAYDKIPEAMPDFAEVECKCKGREQVVKTAEEREQVRARSPAPGSCAVVRAAPTAVSASLPSSSAPRPHPSHEPPCGPCRGHYFRSPLTHA